LQKLRERMNTLQTKQAQLNSSLLDVDKRQGDLSKRLLRVRCSGAMCLTTPVCGWVSRSVCVSVCLCLE
jgi:hypothetical protein